MARALSLLYPIAVFEDRYSGVYSGGGWIAVAECDTEEANHRNRFWVAFDGTHGDDMEAATFGGLIPLFKWIAVGNSPEHAIANLMEKNKVLTEDEDEDDLDDLIAVVDESKDESAEGK